MALTRTRFTRTNESSSLSDYELKRRNKMAEHAKVLRTLGLAKAQQEMTRQLQSSKSPEKTKSSKLKKAVAAPKTLRRSSRLWGAPVRIAVAEKRRLQDEKRKQKIGTDAAKRKRHLAARRKREAAIAAAAAERSLRAGHRAN
ncbi:hypothetical protein PHYPSEUDO_011699 [Phytophthora pseudosyringae]|uniref:Uncharacterized protein n=1 Tax=Phytophthora pseudosyringae TaxID=221518 RepID=A0A8T1W687_9STRA|nr:hypothetical protein PHYPSEUDO_011699 [Phytophthora pseudosyringae]